MPWRTESVMDQRVEFVLRARRDEETMAALCREYEISRPTGYLWLQRYQSAGSVTALAEHSRRPLQSPRRTDEKIAAAVLQVRDEKGWGGAKIAKVLAQQGVQVTAVTAQRILKRSGRVSKPAVDKATQRFAHEQCNELAQMDFKGEYSLATEKCYPLSLLDDCSRYLHGLWPLRSTAGEGVAKSNRQHPVPRHHFPRPHELRARYDIHLPMQRTRRTNMPRHRKQLVSRLKPLGLARLDHQMFFILQHGLGIGQIRKP